MECICVHVYLVSRGADTLMQQAQSWESKGEYLRAIECYARVTADVTSDQNVLQRCWVKVSHFPIFFHILSLSCRFWIPCSVLRCCHKWVNSTYCTFSLCSIFTFASRKKSRFYLCLSLCLFIC